MARTKYSGRNWDSLSNHERQMIRKRQRQAKKWYRPGAIPRGLKARLKTHHFKQTFIPSTTSLVTNGTVSYVASDQGWLTGPNNTSSAGADGGFTYHFILSDLPQASSYSALFDSYRVNKVIFKAIPNVSLTSAPTSAGQSTKEVQFLNSCLDYDDSTALTTLNQCLEYETFMQTPMYKPHVRTFVPAVSQQVYKTSGTTIGFQQRRKQWVDIAYTDVEHYGIKAYIPANPTQADNIQGSWKVYVTVYFSCKQVR